MSFHKHHQNPIVDSYMKLVTEEVKVAEAQNWCYKLYAKIPRSDEYKWNKLWVQVTFEHRGSVEMVAMEPEMKKRSSNTSTYLRVLQTNHGNVVACCMVLPEPANPLWS